MKTLSHTSRLNRNTGEGILLIRRLYFLRVSDYNCEKSLRFLTLNVCGLKSKLLIPEFQSFLFNVDIIVLQETYCDDYDSLELDGYNFFMKK